MRTLLALALALGLTVTADAQPLRSAAPQHTIEAPGSASVQAGGPDRNAVPGSGCSGFIANGSPTASVTVSGDGPLSIFAVSDTDTTLLVSDPSGRWHCSDDANGSDPAVTFARAAEGRYTVWVGTFSPDGRAPARLSAVRGQPNW